MRNDSPDYSPDYSPYSEPHSVFPSPAMELLTQDGFDFSRPAHECFPAHMAAAFDGSIVYADPSYHPLMHERMSPLYPDDRAMRPPNLSTASVTSAPSSAHGSPRSNHGQPAPVPEWAGPQGLGVSPGIVGQHDYYATGTEYATFPGHMDDFPTAPFDFPQPKAAGFVGELDHVPRSHHLQHASVSSSVSLDSSSCTVVPESLVLLDTTVSPTIMSPSSRKNSLVFLSPTTSSFSSPQTPAWSSPVCGGGLSPIAQPNPARLLSPFFSQSSGHFVAPLGSICWFPLGDFSLDPLGFFVVR